ncbi:hypothetical protein [uncultured Amaricoccus sp.]|uniref:hypothetical protein n=1 Tax=uncultured Amaricoccus sp. TaxID=339341 RepID=UPI00262DC8B3|nr:hypothetical protein [uncultured Amaricoccus sp.]
MQCLSATPRGVDSVPAVPGFGTSTGRRQQVGGWEHGHFAGINGGDRIFGTPMDRDLDDQSDLIKGLDGKDFLNGLLGDNLIFGGDGNDTVRAISNQTESSGC